MTYQTNPNVFAGLLTCSFPVRIRVTKHKQVVDPLVIEVVPPMGLVIVQQGDFTDQIPPYGVVEADVLLCIDGGIVTECQGPVVSRTGQGTPYTAWINQPTNR
jgi:hypothetical protein